MPSVRGRERVVVAVVLLASSTASGALAGFALGVAWQAAGWGPAPRWAAVAAVAVALVLDLGVAPLSVRRQVPQLWGRVFSARVAALLYGLRLGVGPLTILRTWLWWAAVALAMTAGVWPSVAVGALFGAARVIVMLAAGTRAVTLVPRERAARVALAVVAVASVLVAAVGGGDDRAGVRRPEVAASRASATTTASTSTTAPPTTAPAPAPVPLDESLAAVLVDDAGPGLTPVAASESVAVGPLDLDRAVAAERDVAAERALLVTRHFERGFARAWRAGGEVVYASVYQFRSPADAAAYLTDGMLTVESRGARVYDVPTVPGARGFTQADRDDGGSVVSHAAAFVRGNRFFLVFRTSRASSSTPDAIAALAAAQAAKVGVLER